MLIIVISKGLIIFGPNWMGPSMSSHKRCYYRIFYDHKHHMTNFTTLQPRYHNTFITLHY